MKKVLTAFLLFTVLCIGTGFGQSVNGIPLKDIDVDYVRIVGTSNWSGTKVNIDIDFGQKQKLWSNDDTKLLDSASNPIKLNSMIDALNFMCKNGYEFLTAYVVTSNNQNVYNYLLRRKK